MPKYAGNDLANIIESRNPEVVFLELPMNWGEKEEKGINNGQEMIAIDIIRKKMSLDIFKIDMPFRNEISENLNLYNNEEFANKIIFGEDYINKKIDKLRIKLKKIYIETYDLEKTTYEYLKSKSFRNNIIKKQRTMDMIIKEYSKINQDITNYYNMNKFYHKNIRENIISYNCIEKMKQYNCGVLLIGAEHIDMGNKMTKHSRDIIANN